MKEIVIIDALRTPVGRYDGALAEYSAAELGTHVVSNLLSKHENIKSDVEQVIFGNVLQAGNGQNIARQIAIHSGLSNTVPASTINEVCGSGMKAVILAKQLLQLGEAEVVIAGGTESMSNAPIIKNRKTQEETLSMLNDGLVDAFSGISMGIIGETIAEQFDISRADQDAFAQNSQEKAVAASQAGIFKEEIVAIGEVGVDETPRPSSSLEKLATLRTAFKENGTVTAGNSSPVNDGASAVILATKDYAATDNSSLPSVGDRRRLFQRTHQCVISVFRRHELRFPNMNGFIIVISSTLCLAAVGANGSCGEGEGIFLRNER